MPTSDGPVLLAMKERAGTRTKFWSEEFFQAASESLNKSPVFSPIFKGMRTTIVAESTDKGGCIMIQVRDNLVSVRPAAKDEPADFRFSAPYDEWVSIVKDDVQLRGEVVKGRVRFRGSMPMMLLMLGKVSKAEKEIVAQMRSLDPEY